MISPGEFIPVAEKSRPDGADRPHRHRQGDRRGGRMAPCRHRVRTACGQRLGHRAARGRFRQVPVRDAAKRTGLPPQKLSLEIVESVILDDEKTGIAAKLRHIRAAGVHLELDDFGTGYASLSHVNPNEIDRLKIDRRFVQNINAQWRQHQDRARHHRTGARPRHLDHRRRRRDRGRTRPRCMSIGCDQVQGYSIAFPMPTARRANGWPRAARRSRSSGCSKAAGRRPAGRPRRPQSESVQPIEAALP